MPLSVDIAARKYFTKKTVVKPYGENQENLIVNVENRYIFVFYRYVSVLGTPIPDKTARLVTVSTGGCALSALYSELASSGKEVSTQ